MLIYMPVMTPICDLYLLWASGYNNSKILEQRGLM